MSFTSIGLIPWTNFTKFTRLLASPDRLKAMLRPYPPERLAMWPVDKRVGNVKNEGPELAEPLTARAQGTLL